jgi:hypothetical protein
MRAYCWSRAQLDSEMFKGSPIREHHRRPALPDEVFTVLKALMTCSSDGTLETYASQRNALASIFLASDISWDTTYVAAESRCRCCTSSQWQ